LGDLDRVRARLALHRENDRALAPLRVGVPRRDLVVLDAVDDATEVLQPYRRAVPVGDDHRAVLVRGGELAGRLDRVRLLRPEEHPGRQVDVGRLDGLRDLVDAEAAARDRVRVELDAHRVLLRAEHLHLRDAAHHGDALRHHRLAVLVDLPHRERRRRERDVEDRLVGRIDLPVDRRRRHAGREERRGLRDRRLHVLRGGVDVAVELELEGHLSAAERARRVHRREPGDRRELPLERRRDRGRHRLGVRARKRSAHEERREVDIREVAHREAPVRDHAGDQDRDHDERGRDRAADERTREVHPGAPVAAGLTPASCLTTTGRPGARRIWPSVTTRSPGATPDAMTTSSPVAIPTSTGRDSTWSSAPTTYTYGPDWPASTACAGTVTASFWVAIVSTTVANCPGQSRSSRFSNSAFSATVPVVASTALSTNRS